MLTVGFNNVSGIFQMQSYSKTHAWVFQVFPSVVIATVKADPDYERHGFDSQTFHCHVTIPGKLFTRR